MVSPPEQPEQAVSAHVSRWVRWRFPGRHNACPDKRLPHPQFRMDRSFGERPTRFLALLLAVRVDAAGGLVLLPATGGLVLLLFGFVPADKAACCCTQDTMMAGIVPCHAADESALEAAFG
jgi:hypothetical protein